MAARGTESITPVGRKLMAQIMKVATLCAVLICLVQGILSWHHARQEYARALAEVGQMHVPLLTLSVWDIEPTAIHQQLQALADKPEIGAVRLTAKTGQVFSLGRPELLESTDVIPFELKEPGGQLVIGRLDVAANPQALVRELIYAVGTSVVGYGILTLVICALVQVVLRQRLELPLRQLANFASALDPGRLTEPLDLERPPLHRRDEIDLVVAGFARLQAALGAHVMQLDALVAERTRELESALQEIRTLSTIDPLTECCNRRCFDEMVGHELARSERNGRPLSVIFTDIDHFKRINDSGGHSQGDEVLRVFSARLRGAIRHGVDSVTRFGGEEFVVLLPDTDLDGASRHAERIRELIAGSPVDVGARTLSITASFGVATWCPGETLSQWLDRADQALYEAKHGGRNRTCASADPAP